MAVASQTTTEEGNIHPDEYFTEYVKLETGLATYQEDEGLLRNRCMIRCFEACNLLEEDIYEAIENVV